MVRVVVIGRLRKLRAVRAEAPIMLELCNKNLLQNGRVKSCPGLCSKKRTLLADCCQASLVGHEMSAYTDESIGVGHFCRVRSIIAFVIFH